MRWFNELPRNFGFSSIDFSHSSFLAEPSQTNIVSTSIRCICPFIIDSPSEMSVCQGNETHFPLELWPVGPNQFGWPVLATCWIGVRPGVFVGAGPRHPPKKKGQTYPNPYSTACNPGCNVWMLQLSQDFVLLFSALQDFFIFRFQTLQCHLVLHPGWECLQVTLIATVTALFLEIQGNPWGLGIPPSGSLWNWASTIRKNHGFTGPTWIPRIIPTHFIRENTSSFSLTAWTQLTNNLVKSKVDQTNQPLSNTNYLNENANNPHNKPKPPKETPWISIRCLLLIRLPHSSMYATCRAFANLL